MAKKKLEVSTDDDKKTVGTETVIENTEAQNSIEAHPTDVSRSDVMAMAMRTLSETPREDLTKWWWETLASYQNLAKGVPDGAAERNKNSLNMKPSNASTANLTAPLASIQAVKEDLTELLGDQENLPEEFVNKALVLFESAVSARVINEAVKIQEQSEKLLAEKVEELAGQVDEYLDYAAKEFFKENQVAIESSVKIDMYEDFVDGLQELFAKHHIALPEERTDVLDTLIARVDELEDELNSRTDDMLAVQDALDAERASRVFKEATKGLTDKDAEQFKKLAETVEFAGDEKDLAEKLKIIRESHFDKKKAPSRALTEKLSDEGKVVTVTVPGEMLAEDAEIPVAPVDPDIAALAAMIGRQAARNRL